jgi:hypothetical protein
MLGKVFGVGLDLAKPRLRRYILDHPDFKPNFDLVYEEQNEMLS